ncbi:FAD binding domain-containing protein [Xylariaceae sp. FL0594]|nr:FAD binding domain-containing protein [Xylariaceae sp. FL0594]
MSSPNSDHVPKSGDHNSENLTTSLDEQHYDVAIIGAGPTGLTLAVILTRLGLKTAVFDDRTSATSVGRADGIQPKTIETLQMLGLAHQLLRDGVRVYDLCIWEGGSRVSREAHYPADVVDVLHPHILLCHQGMVESALIDDLRKSAGGTVVHRGKKFVKYEDHNHTPEGSLDITLATTTAPDIHHVVVGANYLVGCDGARSLVREQIPGTQATTTPHESYWGVLDGELETDFPDLWCKTVVFSEEHGSVLIIPRERNMTRIYIEMRDPTWAKSKGKGKGESKEVGQDFVMEQAKRILAPYSVEWLSVEWFGNYQVAQRVAARFSDTSQRVFIAGDASHTHSPKAAQGMNTGIHDAWNLGWKLNLASESESHSLLQTYEAERKKIAHNLIAFDLEHANEIARGDPVRLAANFRTNTRFISGVGVEYGDNCLNRPLTTTTTTDPNHHPDRGKGADEEDDDAAKPGHTLPPAKATRYIDANPVDLQLDVPVLGQFRVYVLAPDITTRPTKRFLAGLSKRATAENSLLSRLSRAAAQSYAARPRPKRDDYALPARYLANSELFTFCLVTSTPKSLFEISSLPPLFASSPWTVYLDDVPHLDTRCQSCIRKWAGPGLGNGEVAVLNVRPDGYLGSARRWELPVDGGDEDDDGDTTSAGEAAAQWLDEYYGGFLKVPPEL